MSNRLARNFRFMSAAVVGVALVQFVLYFVVARYLGAEDYGTFAVALTMALLAAPLCDLGMNISVVWSHARDPDRLPVVIGTSLVTRITFALPVGAATLAVGYALDFGAKTLWLFVPLFTAAVLDGVTGLFSAVFQAKERMGWSSTILLSRNLARASGLALTLLAGGDLWTLSLWWMVASAASALFSCGLVLNHASIRFQRTAIRPMLRDALPFGSAIIANLLLLQSDILMLGHFAGGEAVGIYHAAFRFIVLAELLPQIISIVIIPRSYRIGRLEGPQKLSRFYRVQTLVLGSVGVLGSLAVALHGSWIANMALGTNYDHSGFVLTALAPLIFLRFMSVPLGDALSSLGYQRRLSRAAWIAFFANLLLNLLLIPTYGALGAAVGTGCSQICMLFTQMYFARDTRLDAQWGRLLLQPLVVIGGIAVIAAVAPATTPWLLPLAIATFFGLWRARPSAEHRSLLRAARS